MTKKILIISILLYCTNVFAQDTLFQCDFSVTPIHFNKKNIGKGNETSFNSTRNIVPSLTLCIPIHNKFSFAIGFNLYKSSYESFFNDSVELIIDPTNPALIGSGGYIYYYKFSSTELLIPLVLNYNLYYNKYFSTNFSLGIEANLWNKTITNIEYYPISLTNSVQHNRHFFNSPIDKYIYSLYINATIKYFPLKHFGLLIRPLIRYNRFENEIYSRLDVGICYR